MSNQSGCRPARVIATKPPRLKPFAPIGTPGTRSRSGEGSLGFRDALRVGRGDDEVVLRALAGEIEAQACKAGVSQRLGKVLVDIADLVLVAVPTMDEQHGAPRVT